MEVSKQFYWFCRTTSSRCSFFRKKIILTMLFYLICVLIYGKLRFQNDETSRTLKRDQPYFAVEENLNKRKSEMERTCQEKYSNNRNLNFSSFTLNQVPWLYISQKYKLLYCQIPKIGSTNWLKMFGVMEGKLKNDLDLINVHTARLPTLYLRNQTQRNMFKSFKSFMVKRDPIQRFFSAYKSKLVPPAGKRSPIFFKLAAEIVHSYRSPKLKHHFQRFPTAHEFAQFITDTNNPNIKPPHQEARHWMPQTRLCYPCNINYNYIINISKIDEESEFLLNLTGVPPSMRYPKQTLNTDDSKNLNKQPPPAHMKLDENDYKALCYYYEEDFEILDLEYPPECR